MFFEKESAKAQYKLCGYKIMRLPYSSSPSREKLSQAKVRLHKGAGVEFPWA